MEQHTFNIHHFIQIARVPTDGAHGNPASPFNLRFKAKPLSEDLSAAISGTCIYLATLDGVVAYLGKYQPTQGRIINDRLGRHLQTITGRGADIGFGGQGNPQKRLKLLLGAICDERLRAALQDEYETSKRRFRDTGYNTTPDRLRFASENWESFGADDEAILNRLSFTLVHMQPDTDQRVSQQQISLVEKRLLDQFRPACNAQYRHEHDAHSRQVFTVDRVTELIRAQMLAVTGSDARDCITLGV